MCVNDSEYAERLLSCQNKWWKRLLNVQWPYRVFLRSLDLGLTLDVGCGVGRNLKTLGCNGVGVDTNETAVGLARQQGFQAFTTEDFRKSKWATKGGFDSLLFAHVFEHMTRSEATETLRLWLPYLKIGGSTVLITPQEKGFKSDPTHVTFMDFDDLGVILQALKISVVGKYSFPFPRFAGRLFTYNEFVILGTKDSQARV